MFTSSNSGHNRLLALEQELMGWKTSPKPQQRQQEQDEQNLSNLDGISDNSACLDPPKSPLKRGTLKKFSPLVKGDWGGSPGWNTDPRVVRGECVSPEQDELTDWETEAEEITAWDSEIQEREELEETEKAEQFSYGELAKMLQSNASQRFRRNVSQLQTLGDELESLTDPEETLLSYPSRLDTSPSVSIPSNQEAVSAFQFSQLPELDLPMSDARSSSDIFDISLPEAEPEISVPVSSSAFSSDEPSYTSLLQVLQSVRQSEPTPDESEEPMLSIAKNSRTIEVETQTMARSEPEKAITEEKIHRYPLEISDISKLALKAAVEQPLLPAATLADEIALDLEPIELEPICDEEDEDWFDEPSDD